MKNFSTYLLEKIWRHLLFVEADILLGVSRGRQREKFRENVSAAGGILASERREHILITEPTETSKQI